MTSGESRTSGPMCVDCSVAVAVVVMDDRRVVCAKCALVAVTPPLASSPQRPRPTVHTFVGL